jgi:hypothetical protein
MSWVCHGSRQEGDPCRNGAPGRLESRPGSFKRRCGSRYRRQGGRARTRLRRAGTPRSPSISRSAQWPHAAARGIVLHCSSAATARCDGVRENTHIGARPGGAISARPPRVHAPVAVPTWRGCIDRCSRCVIVSGARARQRLTAYGYRLCRITRRITATIIVRFYRTQGTQSSSSARLHAGGAARRTSLGMGTPKN